MKIKRAVALSAAAAVAITGFGFAAGAAYADPVTSGYAFVGSDTLQAAVGALANGTTVTGTSVRTTGASKVVASWDAFVQGITGGVGLIQTKSGKSLFPRPTGSGDGKAALFASIGGSDGSTFTWTPTDPSYGSLGGTTYNLNGSVDGARSSDGPASGTPNGGKLTYVPFGQDAVSYVWVAGSSVSADSKAAVAALKISELKAIYLATSGGGALTAGLTAGDSYKPVLPQSSSGTRKFFLRVLDHGDGTGTQLAFGSGTTEGAPENDGTALSVAAYAPTAHQIAIIPFSAAQWIAQNNAIPSVVNTTAGVTLGTIEAESGGTILTPISGTGTNLTPNTAFYAGTNPLSRTTYVIVPTDRITVGNASYDAGLASVVDQTNPQSLTYWSPGDNGTILTSEAVKKKFGFAKPINGVAIN